ncbi:MAG: FimV/HubP family polar landmark protein, partial [Nitrosomonas sp.]
EVVTPGEDNQIDFESGYSDYTEKSENKLTGLGEKFAHIDLNLGDASAALPAVDDVVETENDHWQEVATKIDLAKAYLEMEDWDGAREILQEVLQEGDVEQQTTARTMLSEIGG